MYKVFINNLPFVLTTGEIPNVLPSDGICIRCEDQSLFNCVFDEAIKSSSFFKTTCLYHSNADMLLFWMQERCKLIEAAGGIVKNEEGKILLIYRNEKWDLPKGKLEKGEITTKAAIREVEEECGVNGLIITKPLPSTYHIYIHKEKIVLKKTYWYEMFCSDKRVPVPQTEEGITKVLWADKTALKNALENTFSSIAELIKMYA
jgi:8-oxo-(d)GTP phosphatase